MTEADIPTSRLPDIYSELGRLSGLVEAHGEQVAELVRAIRSLNCASHSARLDAYMREVNSIVARVDKLDGATPVPVLPARQERPPSGGSAPVTARQLEATERTVVASIEGRVAALVTDRLQQARDLERQADERARERIAEHLADTSAASQARWQRVQWIAGVVAALLGSGTAVSWCQLSSQRDVDRAAVVKALKAQPAPVVVRVPVPVPAPVQPREEP